MLYLTTSLSKETCLLLFPWVFKDEECHKRDKKSSPPYIELVEEILIGNYTVEQEIRKRLDEDILSTMFNEVIIFNMSLTKIIQKQTFQIKQFYSLITYYHQMLNNYF